MPTGYTDAIAKDISFEDFVWRCARAFGALVTMRDEPYDAPIPEKFESTDYHSRGLEKAQADLVEFQKLSSADYEKRAQEEYESEIAMYLQRVKEKTTLRNKYSAMLAQVIEWIPPSPDHEKLKSFMASQIRESIDFDCFEPKKPERLSGEDWANKAFSGIMWNINYHTEEQTKEIERVGEHAHVR